MKENQTTEFKLKMNENCLKTCCAFANTEGGKLYIGYDDDGKLIGIQDINSSIEDLPNIIRNRLNLYVSIIASQKEGKDFIEIAIPKVDYPVFYEGKIFVRIGSTNQLLEGNDLIEFILRKSKNSWDDVTVDTVTIEELDEESFRIFRKEGRKNKRIPQDDISIGREQLLEKMSLVRNGKPTRAAVLLFHPHPEYFFPGAHVKLGYFNSRNILKYQDELYGSLIVLAKRIEEILIVKYLYATIEYKGVTRIETLPYAQEAIREGILNALMHNNYMSAQPISIRISPQELWISNMCIFPSGWTKETLFSVHESRQLNPNIAVGFFRAGMVERFGSGIRKIIDSSKDNGNPLPNYVIYSDMITLKMSSRIENTKLALMHELEENGNLNVPESGNLNVPEKTLSKIQKDILVNLIEHERITSLELASKLGVSKKTILRQLTILKENNLIERQGSKRNGKWKTVAGNEKEVPNESQIPAKTDLCPRSMRNGEYGNLNDPISGNINVSENRAGKNLSGRKGKTLGYIEEHPWASISEIAEKTNSTNRTISRELAILKERNIIRRNGSKKTGRWEIIKKEGSDQ